MKNNDSWQHEVARTLGMILAIAVVLFVISVIAWAIIQIGEDISASL